VKNNLKAKKTGCMSQVVQWWQAQSLEFKPQYHPPKKKKKEKENQKNPYKYRALTDCATGAPRRIQNVVNLLGKLVKTVQSIQCCRKNFKKPRALENHYGLREHKCKRHLNCFCWKALTLTWAHELTTNRRKAW
jgi:hypothetical protein